MYRLTISKGANENARQKYKEYNTILQKVKRYAKKSYYIEKCVEFRSNTKKLWKTINEIIGKCSDKGTIIDSLKVDNITIMSSK